MKQAKAFKFYFSSVTLYGMRGAIGIQCNDRGTKLQIMIEEASSCLNGHPPDTKAVVASKCAALLLRLRH